MELNILKTPQEMGVRAASLAAAEINAVIKAKGRARLLVATGASQFTVLEQLCQRSDIDWPQIDGFHLDEYVGIGTTHGASFCKYLKERLVDRVPLGSFHYLRGDGDIADVVAQAAEAISVAPIDVALVGIGENGHLAFNDPPADFETKDPYLVVQLDEACRMQQVGEGWFDSLADVPTHAISMSVQQILQSRRIICSVPDARKASAVAASVEGEVTPAVPASILQRHARTTLLLDEAAASKLSDATRAASRTVNS